MSTGTTHRRFRSLASLLPLLGALAAHPAAADLLPETAADFRRLPPYCAARLNRAGPEAHERWNRVIGPDFVHIHHYCFGLHKLRLAQQTIDPGERARMLKSAIGEIDYVQTHASGSIPFYAEIYTQRGKLHLMLEQQTEAASYFTRAIAEDPRYGPAYSALARLFLQQGHPDQARKLVSEGIKAAPKSPGLRKLQARLGIPSPSDDARPDAASGATPGATPGAGGDEATAAAPPGADGAASAIPDAAKADDADADAGGASP